MSMTVTMTHITATTTSITFIIIIITKLLGMVTTRVPGRGDAIERAACDAWRFCDSVELGFDHMRDLNPKPGFRLIGKVAREKTKCPTLANNRHVHRRSRMSQSKKPLPSILQKHLKLANIEGSNVQEKLKERRLVQIVSYLELACVKLQHHAIHREHFRAQSRDRLAMVAHCQLLDKISAAGAHA